VPKKRRKEENAELRAKIACPGRAARRKRLMGKSNEQKKKKKRIHQGPVRTTLQGQAGPS